MADKDLVGVGACFDKPPGEDRVSNLPCSLAFDSNAEFLENRSAAKDAVPVSCSNSGASHGKKSIGTTTAHGVECSSNKDASQKLMTAGPADTVNLVIRKRGGSKKVKSGK
jgi:hypothetical protein